MTYPIAKIDGLGPQAVAKLKAKGIRTTECFIGKASTPKGRKVLAAATGISEQQLLEWVNTADCMRVPGMGSGKAGLIREAGVSTLREFTYRNPKRLAVAIKDANDRRKLVRVLPSEESIALLIERAKKLDLKIKY